MGVLQTIRSGVKTADKITKPLQCTVSFERMIGDDGYGTKLYAPAVPLRALVDWSAHQVRTQAGVLTMSRVTVTFLDVDALKAATPAGFVTAGIGDDDHVILQDGTTGPIIDIRGFIDAGTGSPFATEVMLG